MLVVQFLTLQHNLLWNMMVVVEEWFAQLPPNKNPKDPTGLYCIEFTC